MDMRHKRLVFSRIQHFSISAAGMSRHEELTPSDQEEELQDVLRREGSPRGSDPWGETMLAPDEVAAMVQLHRLGWGTKRIAGELGCSRNTVKRYLAAGGWVAIRQPRRKRRLDGLEEWLAERFRRHRGNCDVVRQDLLREHGITVSLRTVERATAPLRQALRAEARACLRFETAPGEQLQIDFGATTVAIGGVPLRVHLFVATLGYSRRPFVRAFRHERQLAWFDGMEGAFRRCGAVPQEALLDNARALVDHHDAATREVRFNERLRAFARYWGFRPHACAPYRARTKGKDERGVGYVKCNAIAGHAFDSWAGFEAHLEWWMREIADVRMHGDRRGAAGAFRAGGGFRAQTARRAAAVSADARTRPSGAGRLCGRGRRQQLQRAMAADRRKRAGGHR
jgi:transposase